MFVQVKGDVFQLRYFRFCFSRLIFDGGESVTLFAPFETQTQQCEKKINVL